jgi:hypothetical protein
MNQAAALIPRAPAPEARPLGCTEALYVGFDTLDERRWGAGRPCDIPRTASVWSRHRLTKVRQMMDRAIKVATTMSTTAVRSVTNQFLTTAAPGR